MKQYWECEFNSLNHSFKDLIGDVSTLIKQTLE